MTGPSLLTFDCYGTLIDWHGGLCRALADLGIPADERDALAARYVLEEQRVEAGPYLPYRDVMALALERTMAATGRTLPSPRRWILSESLPDWEPFPEVRVALAVLARRAPLAILSNVDDDLLDASVGRLGVPFAHLVTAQQVRSYKPAEAHFRRAQDLARQGSGEMLHIAASLVHDIEPARALGIAAIWVNRRGEPHPPWLPPARTVNTLEEVCRLLEASGGSNS